MRGIKGIPLLIAIFLMPAFSMNAAAMNKADEVYLRSAAEANMFEVAFGKLCLSNSTNPEIQDFGRMLVDDHSLALRKLEDEARNRRFDLPRDLKDEQRRTLELFSGLRGDRFDLAAAAFSIADHMGAIKDAEIELKLGEASEIKDLANDMLPSLNRHLDAAISMLANLSYKRGY